MGRICPQCFEYHTNLIANTELVKELIVGPCTLNVYTITYIQVNTVHVTVHVTVDVTVCYSMCY